MLLINNCGDACTVTLPPSAPDSTSELISLSADQLHALPCSAPIADFAVADLQGLKQSQVLLLFALHACMQLVPISGCMLLYCHAQKWVAG